MPFGTITSTESTFGSISGDINGIVAGTISGSVGVPGLPGPTGPQGDQGLAGEGVPAGGTAGQVLAKVDGVDYNTEWVNVEGDYLPLAGGTMTGNIYFDGTSGQYIGKGSFDTSRGGNYGISLMCSVGYEFNWQAGWLTTTVQGSSTPRPLYLDSLAGTTLRVWNSSNDLGTEISHSAITMADGSTDSEVAPWGFGVEITGGSSQYATVEPQAVTVSDGTNTTTVTPAGVTFPNTTLNGSGFEIEVDSSQGGSVAGYYGYMFIDSTQVYNVTETWTDVGGSLVSNGRPGFALSNSGLTFSANTGNPATGTIQYLRSQITFGNGSVQTIAFPGFTGYAPLASPAFTGGPTAPTPNAGSNNNSIATTAFVTTAVTNGLAGGTAIAKNIEVQVRNQSGSTITAGSIVYLSGATGNLPLISKAQANSDANSAQTIGFVKTSIANNGTGYVIVRGVLENIDTQALTEGVQLYLSPTTAGAWTTTKPYAPSHLVYVGIVTRSHPTLGTIVVAVQNGAELDEIHNVSAQTPSNLDLLSYNSSTSLWQNSSFSTLGLLTSAAAASTYQTQAGMSSYLTTVSASSTYLAKSDNLASLTSASTARTNLGLGTAATLASSAVAQTANNLSDLASASTARTNLGLTSLATASFATLLEAQTGSSSTAVMSPVRTLDVLTDCTWSVMPITTATTATSGTGASYVNVSPDYGYLTGPNANLAGYCQKNFNMFARSNSTYGFNYTKEVRVACKMAINWTGTFTGITYTLFHRHNTGTTNGTLSQIGFGISINMATKVLSILAHNGTTLTTKTTSWSAPTSGICSVDFMVRSDGAGTVYAYADGVLIDSTTGMSTATSTTGLTQALAQVEINSAGGTSTANATGYVCNLRSFVAHG